MGSFYIDKISKELIFTVEKENDALTIGELVKHLLILDMDAMMYEVKLAVRNCKRTNLPKLRRIFVSSWIVS